MYFVVEYSYLKYKEEDIKLMSMSVNKFGAN